MHSRWTKRLLAAAIGVFAAAFAFELALRFVLFADTTLAHSVGYRLRRARCYCDYKDDEDYWKLGLRFGEVQPIPSAMYHSELGWISGEIEPVSLRHRRAGELGGRKPVLLYGDSFARCVTSREDCFEGLLEKSDLGQRECLLNYGVAGYGLDQIQLLIEHTIDLYSDLHPIVVVGIFVDDDLDRVAAHIRNWPKPRFVLRDGALVPDASPVPSLPDFLAAHPIDIHSYAWRWLLHASDWLPRKWVARMTDDPILTSEKQTLSRRILDEIEHELSTRGLEHFYLVFHGEEHLAHDRPSDWRDEIVDDFLRETRAPFVMSAPYLWRAAQANGTTNAAFFGTDGIQQGHYLPGANAVVFEALHDGLEQKYGRLDAGTDSAERRRSSAGTSR